MKTLTVYYPHGYKKFEGVFDKYFFNADVSGGIEIWENDPITGESILYAGFSKWDYFLIEEE